MNFKLSNVVILPFLVVFMMGSHSLAYDLPVNTGALSGEVSVTDLFTGRTQVNELRFDAGSAVACTPMSVEEIMSTQSQVGREMGINHYALQEKYRDFLEANPLKYVVLRIPQAGEIEYNYSFDTWRVPNSTFGFDILAGLDDKDLSYSDGNIGDDSVSIIMETDEDLFPSFYSSGQRRFFNEDTAWNDTSWYEFPRYSKYVRLRITDSGYGEVTSPNGEILYILRCKEQRGFNDAELVSLRLNGNMYDFVTSMFSNIQ